MRFLPLVLAALLSAGCAPKPSDFLTSALAHSAKTPHTITGKATRTLAQVGSQDRLIVSWEVKSAFASPYALVELKGTAGTRRTIGKQGWWVELYDSVWRPYPPPYEAIEWLDPAGLEAGNEYGPDQTVSGVACRRVLATHPAGQMTFDISKSEGRLMRVIGGTTDGADVYEFDLTFDWTGGKVEPEPGAIFVLDALAGAKPGVDDAAAHEAATRAWSVLPKGTAIVTTVQIDFINAAEIRRRSGYLEQDPPLRAWNMAEEGRQVYLFSDGTRSLAADNPDGVVHEMTAIPKAAVDEVANLDILKASFAGDCDHRGTKCRLVAAELRSKKAEPGTGSSISWLWIAPDGHLLRQLMIGKATLAGEGAREATTCVDISIRPEVGEIEMKLLKRARELFHR
ncbi:MAG: hypothetical protein K8T20_11725 [Planctomycetes bacterium]|nr:hypothetical protein [Planctomycetota bacterium]